MNTGNRIRKRWAVAGATALLLVVPAVVLLSQAQAGVNPTGQVRPTQTIAWQPCEENSKSECGEVAVPIDWSEPGGPTISIAVIRRRASDSNRLGTLVFSPGGPGGSGVEAVLSSYDAFPREVTNRYDLVSYDARGVGRSHEIKCPAGADTLPSPVVNSQMEFNRAVSVSRTYAAQCRRMTGPLFEHVDTISVVHDLDAIRAALGEEQIAIWGYSYGTQVGLQYAELYGDRLKAMIVDSVVDHSVRNPALLMDTSAAGEDSFDEFAAWCERNTACVLHDKGVRPVWQSLSKKAAAGTLPSPYDRSETMGTYELATMVRTLLTGPYWSGLAKIMKAMDTGSDIKIAQSPLAPPAATTAVECQDWDRSVHNYHDYEKYVRQAWSVAGDIGPSPDALASMVHCVGWPARIANPQHRLQVTKGPKIVVVNSLHDPATGYAWAQLVAQQLGDRGVLVTYEGWGHGNYDSSPCTMDILVSYINDGKIPSGNVRCPAVEPSLEYQDSILGQ
jgi:pimeloyl-ACP methyl ester carboxylesterase